MVAAGGERGKGENGGTVHLPRQALCILIEFSPLAVCRQRQQKLNHSTFYFFCVVLFVVVVVVLFFIVVAVALEQFSIMRTLGRSMKSRN